MMVEVDAADVVKRDADSRGRVTLGSEFADETVTIAVVEVEDEDE